MIWIKGFPATSDRAIDVVEWEFTGVFCDATEKIARALLLVATAMLCVSCRTDNRLGPSQATPIIYSSEMSAREDCLYREVARLLEPKGSPPTSLHNIAATATRFCSEAIRSRFQQAVSAQDVQVLAKEDQARTEQRAFAIGLELRESRNVGGGQLKPGCDGAIRLGGHHHPAQHCPPPSTRSTWPDTNAPSGPANTSTTRATSSTVAMRSSVPASTIRF